MNAIHTPSVSRLADLIEAYQAPVSIHAQLTQGKLEALGHSTVGICAQAHKIAGSHGLLNADQMYDAAWDLIDDRKRDRKEAQRARKARQALIDSMKEERTFA